MRPSGITDGMSSGTTRSTERSRRFNEAVGYYRRNGATSVDMLSDDLRASMRPSGITDGMVGPMVDDLEAECLLQ